MKIEIWSDVACPFCYIGKRKFEKALAQFEHRDEVKIEWKSFQLDPTIPDNIDQSIGMYQYLADRKGISLKESIKMHENVSKIAKDVGLLYNFDKTKISNTLNASRLIQMAKKIDKQNEIKEKLMAAHFTHGLNVADDDVLVKIGEESGLNADEIRSMLVGDDYRSSVAADIQEAKKLGISGVPFFLIDGKISVSGAQDPRYFLQTLEKAYRDWKK